jgi:hypothetical protein
LLAVVGVVEIMLALLVVVEVAQGVIEHLLEPLVAALPLKVN